jgi:hypothetical protein
MEALHIGDTLVAKSDQLNADDLTGGPITVGITNVRRAESAEQPVIVEITGGHRPWKPCKTMRRALAFAWGENAAEWIGHGIVLYRDNSVKWGGEEVGGIRIKAMSHIDRAITINLTATKGKKQMHRIEVLKPWPPEQRRQESAPNDDAMSLDNFKKWLAYGMSKKGWTKDGVARLLNREAEKDNATAEDVPSARRQAIADLMSTPPPNDDGPPADEE